ncbi:hypothetical protein [Paenibacillus sp. sgz302251]
MHDLEWFSLEEALTKIEYAISRMSKTDEEYAKIREIADNLKVIVEKNNR